MNTTVWKPNVTVAAVVERGGRFLLVEEQTERGLLFNQPAGHLEEGESLIEAAVRETLEETACRFTPHALLGVYQYRSAGSDITYLRFAFTGEVGEPEAGRALDEGIVRATWVTMEDIRAGGARHRTPLVVRCAEDYLAGRRFPLDLITHYA